MSVIREVKVKIEGRREAYPIMVESYNSAMEVVDDCRKRKITDSNFDDKSEKSFGRWEGVSSYDEALELLHNGYQPTVDELKSAIKSTIVGESKRMSFANNIVGFAPVVPLAMKGVPNCMIDMKMKPIKAKVIDIYYDVTMSCSTDSEDIIRNGQKVLGAIMELEKQGYKFNLYAVQSYSGSDNCDILTVKIKSSNQPLDLKRISFPLTHTAFFRVVGFDWYSRTPKGTYRSGYGRALGYRYDSKQMVEISKQLWGNNALYISGKSILEEGQDYIKEEILNGTNNKRTK